MALKRVESQLAPFGSLKFLATGGFQNRAATLYDVRHIGRGEFLNLVGNQAAITTVDSLYLESAENSRAGHGTYCSIHTGGVTSGCQNAYTFDFCHIVLVLLVRLR